MCAGQVSTLIGYGSPNKADTHDVHGAPLGKDETAATRENLKWNYGEFEVGPGFAPQPGQSTRYILKLDGNDDPMMGSFSQHSNIWHHEASVYRVTLTVERS